MRWSIWPRTIPDVNARNPVWARAFGPYHGVMNGMVVRLGGGLLLMRRSSLGPGMARNSTNGRQYCLSWGQEMSAVPHLDADLNSSFANCCAPSSPTGRQSLEVMSWSGFLAGWYWRLRL